jgi:hypothetical protein
MRTFLRGVFWRRQGEAPELRPACAGTQEIVQILGPEGRCEHS